MADFQAINSELVDAGFDLYDITVLQRLGDGTLGWFYPVYLNRRLAHLKPRRFWSDASNEQVIELQIQRRQQILARLAEVLPQILALRRLHANRFECMNEASARIDTLVAEGIRQQQAENFDAAERAYRAALH